jgi:putative SbcD/Mre11-related phosphoesterase
VSAVSSLPESIKFIDGYPALKIGRSRVAIADLHVGYELAARDNGIHIPDMLPRYKERISSIAELSQAEELLIVGDLKNSIITPSIEESQELFRLISFMKERFTVTLIPGNHDALMEKILGNEIKFAPSTGLILEEQGKKITLLHGHARPSKAAGESDIIVMAHFHFFIKYAGGKYPVWLVGRSGEKTLILMPPFNDLLPGFSIKNFDMQIPFFKVKVADLEAITLNGYDIGRVSKLGAVEAEFD